MTDIINRTELKAALEVNEKVKVTFTKTNGRERVVYATLMENAIRVLTGTGDKMAHEKAVRAQNPEVQPVWDTDIGEWRSFRWDRVTEWVIGDERADPDAEPGGLQMQG